MLNDEIYAISEDISKRTAYVNNDGPVLGSLTYNIDYFANALARCPEAKGNYRYSTHCLSTCVIAYGQTDNRILHYSRIDNGVVTSKLGLAETVRHSNIDSYYPDTYGIPQGYFILIEET